MKKYFENNVIKSNVKIKVRTLKNNLQNCNIYLAKFVTYLTTSYI